MNSPGCRNLVLFDIDGTLVDCGGVSARSFSRAFEEIFRVSCPTFPPDQVAGLTDGAIFKEVLKSLDLPCDKFDQRQRLVFESYARILAGEFRLEPPRELPGANRAVQTMARRSDCALGLLTGSTRATAEIKLKSAGIDFHKFRFGAFAEDGELRESLPPAARSRFAEIYGREPNATVLIGDTPRDVEAALATGCSFVGVLTGHYDREALRKAGADLVLNDLSEPNALLAAIAAAIESIGVGGASGEDR